MQEGLQKHSIKYLPAEEDCSENFFSTFQLFKEKRGFRRPEPSLGRVRRALSGEPIRRNAIHSLIHPHHIWLITSILLNHEMRTRAISDESPKDIETQFDLSSIRVMELRAWMLLRLNLVKWVWKVFVVLCVCESPTTSGNSERRATTARKA